MPMEAQIVCVWMGESSSSLVTYVVSGGRLLLLNSPEQPSANTHTHTHTHTYRHMYKHHTHTAPNRFEQHCKCLWPGTVSYHSMCLLVCVYARVWETEGSVESVTVFTSLCNCSLVSSQMFMRVLTWAFKTLLSKWEPLSLCRKCLKSSTSLSWRSVQQRPNSKNRIVQIKVSIDRVQMLPAQWPMDPHRSSEANKTANTICFSHQIAFLTLLWTTDNKTINSTL